MFSRHKRNKSLSRGRESRRGNIPEVLAIAWPIVISTLSYTAMDVFDTIFVGQLGKTELAAVGLATTVFFLINAFFWGTFKGVNIICAQATGAGQPERAISAALTGVLLAVPAGLLVVGMSLFGESIFALMGGPALVQSVAQDYFSIRALGAAFAFITVALCGYFLGIGDTRTPMYVNLVANAVNIVLDVVLIFGLGPVPAMGVEGAALATILAQAVALLVIFPTFMVRVGLRHKVSWESARDILRLGLPVGMHWVLGVSAFALFTAFLARLGEDELAAHQVALKIVSVSFLPGRGVAEAATILCGQFAGAGNFEAVRRAYRSSLIVAVTLMGACGVVFWLFPEPLVRIFNDDPALLALATKLLLVAAVFQLFDAVAMVSSSALNGTGDTRFTMWSNVACAWVIMIPCAYTFAFVLGWGAVGAWAGLVVEIAAVAMISMLRFVSGRWQRQVVVRREG